MAKRFQFRLRTLLLAFVPAAFVALPVGWYLRRPIHLPPVPVTGIVTLDGAPLDGAGIVFMPLDGYGNDRISRRAEAVADITGKFKLQLGISGFTPIMGCIPGPYAVSIRKWKTRDPPPGTEIVSITPERYADSGTSGLTVEVTKDGPNNFTFDLTTP